MLACFHVSKFNWINTICLTCTGEEGKPGHVMTEIVKKGTFFSFLSLWENVANLCISMHAYVGIPVHTYCWQIKTEW